MGVSVAELLREDVPIKRARKTGPTGKVHKVFEEVSKLPRRQQEKSWKSSPRSLANTRRADSEVYSRAGLFVVSVQVTPKSFVDRAVTDLLHLTSIAPFPFSLMLT